MSYFIARKEQTNRNTSIHLQISHVVHYHWGLTIKKVTGSNFDRGEQATE